MPVTQIEYREYESEETDDQPSSLYWAHVAADRDRFRKRIEQLSGVLSKVFDSEYRQVVYKERFENYSPPIIGTLSIHRPENTSIETVTNTSITSLSSATTIESSLSLSQSSPAKESVTSTVETIEKEINTTNQVASTDTKSTISAASVAFIGDKEIDN